MDFLACDAFIYSCWKNYFTLLNSKTGVTVGASTDKTGNIEGSDWIMESTGENIKSIYFSSHINIYSRMLNGATSVSADNIYIKQNGSNVEYSVDNSLFTTITWPLTIIAGTSGSCLCQLVNAINLTDVTQYIIIGSNNITFDGQGY